MKNNVIKFSVAVALVGTAVLFSANEADAAEVRITLPGISVCIGDDSRPCPPPPQERHCTSWFDVVLYRPGLVVCPPPPPPVHVKPCPPPPGKNIVIREKVPVKSHVNFDKHHGNHKKIKHDRKTDHRPDRRGPEPGKRGKEGHGNKQHR